MVIKKSAQIAELWLSSLEFQSTLERRQATTVRFNLEPHEVERSAELAAGTGLGHGGGVRLISSSLCVMTFESATPATHSRDVLR
jgi:hypothetical protein